MSGSPSPLASSRTKPQPNKSPEGDLKGKKSRSLWLAVIDLPSRVGSCRVGSFAVLGFARAVAGEAVCVACPHGTMLSNGPHN